MLITGGENPDRLEVANAESEIWQDSARDPAVSSTSCPATAEVSRVSAPNGGFVVLGQGSAGTAVAPAAPQSRFDPAVSMATCVADARRPTLAWDGRKFDALIFQGSGTKGLVYAGAAMCLQDAGILESVKCFAGTSAGAQTAALLAAGYSVKELQIIMQSTPWKKLMDRRYGCCHCFPNLYRLFKSYGICKGAAFQKYMDMLLFQKLGKKMCTLRELHNITG